MSSLRVMVMAALVLGTASLAFAQPKVVVDEYGFDPVGLVFGTLMPDPTGGYMGGLVLVYPLTFPVTPGDLRVLEPGTTILSDVIRFTDNSQLIFYSDGTDGLDAPADIPIPLEQIHPYIGPITTRDEIGTEGGGMYVDYIPTPNEPGFFSGGGAEYLVISDTPEPSTALLAGAGILMVRLVRRWRTRKAAE